MDLSETKRVLQEVNEYLAKQSDVRDEGLRKIDAAAKAKQQIREKEIRVLTGAINDARVRRRFRVAEALQPRLDEEIRLLSSLEDGCRRAKVEIHRLHRVATSEFCKQRDRLANILANAATIERQREMQIKRHRKIPVM